MSAAAEIDYRIQSVRFQQGYGVDTTDDSSQEDNRFSYAIRSGKVTGLSDARSSWSNAASQAVKTFKTALDVGVTENGTYPEEDGEWFLKYISVTPITDTEAMCHAEYRPLVQTAYILNPGHIEQLSYHDGQDGSDLPFADGRIQHRIRRIPTMSIQFSHNYYQTDAPALNFDSHDTINSGSYTLNGLATFATDELLFLAPHVSSVRHLGNSGSARVWTVNWSFIFNPEKWVEHQLDVSQTEVTEKRMYPRSAFPSIP